MRRERRESDMEVQIAKIEEMLEKEADTVYRNIKKV